MAYLWACRRLRLGARVVSRNGGFDTSGSAVQVGGASWFNFTLFEHYFTCEKLGVHNYAPTGNRVAQIVLKINFSRKREDTNFSRARAGRTGFDFCWTSSAKQHNQDLAVWSSFWSHDQNLDLQADRHPDDKLSGSSRMTHTFCHPIFPEIPEPTRSDFAHL